MAKQRAENMDGQGTKRGQYPYYSLEKSIEVAAAVCAAGGGRVEVKKSVLAQQLRMDESSAAFSQIISAAKCFGLIQGWGTYSLSEIGKEYLLPTDENQKRRAILKMVKCPEVFEKLIERFDGSRLPNAEILFNILHRDFHVAESWRGRVSSLFSSALRMADAIDDAGFLRYSALMHTASSGSGELAEEGGRSAVNSMSPPEPPMIADSVDESRKRAPLVFSKFGDDLNVWAFKLGGGTVRLETSDNLPLELWKKLDQYVQVLKPSESGE